MSTPQFRFYSIPYALDVACQNKSEHKIVQTTGHTDTVNTPYIHGGNASIKKLQ